jgi:HEAT repeat protein
MTEQEWKTVIDALRARDDISGATTAALKLHETATPEDLPRLMQLLTDDDFLVREAAAWPVAELAGPAALPELLQALQRGFDEGHDNDGFQTALADLVGANRTQAREVVTRLANSLDKPTRENAAWLLEYCEKPSGT